MPQHVPPRIYRRVPFETAVRLRFDRFHGFVEQYSANLSLGGMFIRSDEPPPVGTDLAVEFHLEDGFELIRGRGRVTWVREAAEGEEAGGFGLRFLELTPGSRELIFRLVERRVREGDRVFDLDDAAPATATSRLVHDEERLAAPPWDLPAPRAGDEAGRVEGGGAAGGEATLYGRAAREAAAGEETVGGGLAVVRGEAPMPPAAPDPEASFAGLVEADEEDEEGGGRLGPVVGDGEPGAATGEEWTAAGGAAGAEAAGAAGGAGEVRGQAPTDRGAAGTGFAAEDEGEARPGGDRAEGLTEGSGVAAGAAGGAAAGAAAIPADAGEGVAFGAADGATAGDGEAVRGSSSWERDASEPAAADGVSVRDGDATGDGSPGSPVLGDDRPTGPAADAAPADAGEPWAEPDETTAHGFAGGGHAGGSAGRGRWVAAIAAGVAVVAVGGFLLFRARASSQDGIDAAASPVPAAVAAGTVGDGAAGASDPAAGAAGGSAGSPTAPAPPPPPAEGSGEAPENVAPPPAAAPPPADGPRTVERIDWRRRDGGLDFDIAGGRPIAAGQVDHFRVAGERPRLVVRIAGIERPYGRGEIAVGGPLVERVRTGFHPAAAGGGGSVHVVFDLASAGARAAVDAAGGGVRVRIEEP